jgi:hypothetical protein
MSDNAAPEPRPDDDPDREAYVFHAVGKTLLWDYARALFALFVVAGVVGVMAPWTIAWGVMVLLFLAIAAYLLNTVYRHGLRIEMNGDGVTSGWHNPLDATGPVLLFRKHLPWEGLADLHLRYFSRKRDNGQEGWIMFRLKGTGSHGQPVTITFDGAHEGFRPVLNAAWRRAQTRGLALDDTTVANLEALGFLEPGGGAWTS